MEQVHKNTAPQVVRDTRDRLEELAGDEAGLARRLEELSREWEVERVLQLESAAVAALGLALSTLHNRRWAILSGAALGFLATHALRGWKLPMPLLKKLGLRSRTDIEQERLALRALRGDFADLAAPGELSAAARARAALKAAQEP